MAELVFVVATHLSRFSWPIGGQAAEQLKSQGGFLSTHPAHSGVRGITATSFHLGATPLLATGPWWVLATASAHVTVNLVFVRWARRRLVSVEVFSAVVSVALLVAGLAASDLRRVRQNGRCRNRSGVEWSYRGHVVAPAVKLVPPLAHKEVRPFRLESGAPR
ncbi:hypothetical protein GCM10022243_39770 [Saccharothrix violaceirubra]